jgi:acyl-CoA synthetase (AMP-forming)/AMP-acid ligase II
MALGGTFSSGGSIVLQPIFDPDDAVELIQAERVSFPLAWPHQWAQLEQSPRWGSADLGSFRYVDPKTPAGRHPTVSTRWSDPVASYGSTETFTISTVFPSDTPPEVIGGSNGKALPGNTVKVVDRVSGAMLPRGQRGEIAVKGPTLMLGYLGVPADETLDGEGFFRTGDEGFIDVEGRLVFEGRLTDIIKTGGANVSPVEVDGMLDTHPGVKLTKTVGVPHETLGEMVVSCIVRHDHMSLDESAVREFLREHLASYKVPRRVLFFREGELTLTATGKVKGGDLQELVAKRLDVADSAA